ncbi:unnamed protein product [Medioppia subpectinata]|uniref:Uncharacterized protein n=1 Tax=Medioppia subpectinata TaxID=1979941 RepID=A0A7R9Q0P5_9ACAR|nr:unnamed protein product [Medioppia subpectinata]CAG2107543.1 unnamed protein product [Medioppia subpectinata]
MENSIGVFWQRFRALFSHTITVRIDVNLIECLIEFIWAQQWAQPLGPRNLISIKTFQTMSTSQSQALTEAEAKYCIISIYTHIEYINTLPASGASLNPARTLGPAFVMNRWKNHWFFGRKDCLSTRHYRVVKST